MREKLLKYGLSPELLTKRQLENFYKYAEDIKNGNLTFFYGFAEKINQSAAEAEPAFNTLHEKIKKIISKALALAEKLLPDSNQSLLVSFGKTSKQSDFSACHVEFLINMSRLSNELNVTLKEYEKAMSNKSDTHITELTLRYIALAEFAKDSEIFSAYSKLYKSRENLTIASTVKKYEEYSQLILTLDTEIKKLCADADIAYQAIDNGGTSVTNYYRILRHYTSLLHRISLQINELQGGKNEKI